MSGVINDFGGPYYVSEDNMTFGWPTKYWMLDPQKAAGGPTSYDKSVAEASSEYRKRMVIAILDVAAIYVHCCYSR